MHRGGSGAFLPPPWPLPTLLPLSTLPRRLLREVTLRRVVFAAAAAAAFAACTAAAEALYGRDALQEGLLYHASRRDVRHNFSFRWLGAYFGLADEPGGSYAAALLRAAPALAQLGAVSGVALACWRDLPLCFFLQTLAFVACNGVVTAQYFNWWLALLPLVLPHSRLPLASGVVLGGAWLAAELHWLSWAYALEMQGEAVHGQLAAAAALFAAANAAVGVVVALHHRSPFGALQSCGQRSSAAIAAAGLRRAAQCSPPPAANAAVARAATPTRRGKAASVLQQRRPRAAASASETAGSRAATSVEL